MKLKKIYICIMVQRQTNISYTGETLCNKSLISVTELKYVGLTLM